MVLMSNKIEKDQLKPGDHIYSYRIGYAHHGIYVGGDQVIHFTVSGEEKKGGFQSSSSAGGPICYKCGDQSRLSGVISSCLDCFLRKGDIHLFEYGVSIAYFLLQGPFITCHYESADPVEVVLHRAYYLLRNGFGVYDLFKNNCVDFAVYCKTSRIIPPGGGGPPAAGAVVLALFGYRMNSGRRNDVRKVPVEGLADLMLNEGQPSLSSRQALAISFG